MSGCARSRRASMPFICANPDLIVHRGDEADLLRGRARQTLRARSAARRPFAGKPHAPIYHAALAAAQNALGRRTRAQARHWRSATRMRTDVAGAAAQGLDTLFVSAGIHHGEVHGDENFDTPEALERLFAREGLWPTATIPTLRP